MSVDTRPRTKHCQCGNVIGPSEQWCSRFCYEAEVGVEEDPQFELADLAETGPFG